MAARSLNVNYQVNEGTKLPGFPRKSAFVVPIPVTSPICRQIKEGKAQTRLRLITQAASQALWVMHKASAFPSLCAFLCTLLRTAWASSAINHLRCKGPPSVWVNNGKDRHFHHPWVPIPPWVAPPCCHSRVVLSLISTAIYIDVFVTDATSAVFE